MGSSKGRRTERLRFEAESNQRHQDNLRLSDTTVSKSLILVADTKACPTVEAAFTWVAKLTVPT